MCVDGAGNDCVGSGVKIVMVRVIAVGVLVIAALTGACSAQTDRQASAARSTTTGSTRRPGPAKQTGAERVGVLPQRPAALAVGPDGGLYIADDTRNEILERRPVASLMAGPRCRRRSAPYLPDRRSHNRTRATRITGLEQYALIARFLDRA
jgi:hypothetical protein